VVIQVNCYAGYRGEETPREIRFASHTIGVKKILDRWLAPDHRYFKILGDDDATYIIRHEAAGYRWELTLYRDKTSPFFPEPFAENHHSGRRHRD
jgi:hypothetical protein